MLSNSGEKRTYVWAKAKRTCVLLAIGEQEREIQNSQVYFIKVRDIKKSDLVEARPLVSLAFKKELIYFFF